MSKKLTLIALGLFAASTLLIAPRPSQAAATFATVSTLAGTTQQQGTTDGIGAAARFYVPEDLALSADGTFALVSDTGNGTIRKIDLATAQVATIAGTPGQFDQVDGIGLAARFFDPTGITLSQDGSVALIADACTVRKLVVATGAVTTIAGRWPSGSNGGSCTTSDGVGDAARFSNVWDVALSADGKIAVTSDVSHVIRKIDMATGQVTTLAGLANQPGGTDGVGASARFFSPQGVALTPDGTTVLVADTTNQAIRKIDLATGQVTTLAGVADPLMGACLDGTGAAARFSGPSGLAMTNDGRTALVVEYACERVRMIDVASGKVTTLAGLLTNLPGTDGPGPVAGFDFPFGIAVSPDGRLALVADTTSDTIRRIDISRLPYSVNLPFMLQ